MGSAPGLIAGLLNKMPHFRCSCSANWKLKLTSNGRHQPKSPTEIHLAKKDRWNVWPNGQTFHRSRAHPLLHPSNPHQYKNIPIAGIVLPIFPTYPARAPTAFREFLRKNEGANSAGSHMHRIQQVVGDASVKPQAAVVLYAVVMAAIIVGVDFAFFRNRLRRSIVHKTLEYDRKRRFTRKGKKRPPGFPQASRNQAGNCGLLSFLAERLGDDASFQMHC